MSFTVWYLCGWHRRYSSNFSLARLRAPCQGTGFWPTDGKCLLYKWTDKHKNVARKSRSTYQTTLDGNSHFTQIAHAQTRLHSEIRRRNSNRKFNVCVCVSLCAGCMKREMEVCSAKKKENKINALNEGKTSE